MFLICFVTVKLTKRRADRRESLGKADEDKEKEEDEGRYVFSLCHYRGEYLMAEKM